jgi:two-component system OmpR family response regulator
MVDAARVLVVSEDDFLSEAVTQALRNDQYLVERGVSWRLAERLLSEVRPHVVIIDAESEGVDERAVVDRVRMVTNVPLVVLTPSPALESRLTGLRAGADEVMPKPFPLSELACRVAVLLRRNGHRPAIVELGDLVVDEGARTVERRGRPIELTAIEFALLLAFCRNSRLVLSKTQLLTMVWGFDHYNLNLVEVHVSALRRKLEAAGPRMIHTVRGAGYALRPDRSDRSDRSDRPERADPYDRYDPNDTPFGPREGRGDRRHHVRRSESPVPVA